MRGLAIVCLAVGASRRRRPYPGSGDRLSVHNRVFAHTTQIQPRTRAEHRPGGRPAA